MKDSSQTSASKRETMIDWFVGSILNSKIEVTEELMGFMVLKAGEYLMTKGGPPSWEEWCLMGEASQDAFRTAIGDINVRRALESK